jgi:hypothetical protein
MLIVMPLLWHKLQSAQALSARWSGWGTRLAGLCLSGTAAWGLWMGLVHEQAPWCVPPPNVVRNALFLDAGQYILAALT